MLPWMLAITTTLLLGLALDVRQHTPRRFVRGYAPAWLKPPPQPRPTPAVLARLIRWLQRPALEAAFPDLLAHLATRTAAGATLVAALADAPHVLPEPLRSHVQHLVAATAITPVPVALEQFAARTALPIASNLAHVLRHQQAVGAPVAEALSAEDAHLAGLQRQQARLVARNLGALMAIVTVLLLINACAILLYPAGMQFKRLLGSGQL